MATIDYKTYTSIVNVKDPQYGAVGDGVTDDSVAIRLALAAGNNIFFPEGTYLISQDGANNYALSIASNQRLFGVSSKLSKIKLDASQPVHMFLTAASTSKVEFSNLELDGNAANQGAGENYSAIFFGLSNTDLTVKNCTIHDADHSGIYVGTGSSRILIQENVLYDNRYAGVYLAADGVSAEVNTAQISNNISYSNGNAGIAAAGSYINVVGNICHDNGDGSGATGADNITTYYSPVGKHNVISGNVTHGGGNHGIHTGGDYCIVSNNTVLDPSGRGIMHANTGDDSACTSVQFIGNNIKGAGSHGIEFRDVDIGVISGNVIESSTGHGILVTDGASAATNDDLVIADNYIKGSTIDAVRIVNGSDITVKGNMCITQVDGVKYSDSTRISVSGNLILSSSTSGIIETGTNTNCMIRDNDIFSSTANSINTTSGSTIVDGNRQDTAITVASASSLTLPEFASSGDLIPVTGTTGITSITARHAGFVANLQFADVVTVTDGSNLKLQGNYTSAAEEVLSLICDGTNWYEVSRSQVSALSGKLENIVEDTTPQLGGTLDANGNSIQFADNTGIIDANGNELMVFQTVSSAANYFDFSNSSTGNDIIMRAQGDDTDIDIRVQPKGSGVTQLQSGLLAFSVETQVISSGAITVSAGHVKVDTEASASSDDLDTINGGVNGAILVIRANAATRTVVAKDGTGNLILAGDFTMDNNEDTLMLISDGTNWREISRSDNGA